MNRFATLDEVVVLVGIGLCLVCLYAMCAAGGC